MRGSIGWIGKKETVKHGQIQILRILRLPLYSSLIILCGSCQESRHPDMVDAVTCRRNAVGRSGTGWVFISSWNPATPASFKICSCS